MTDDLLYQLDGKMQLVKDDFYLLKKSRDCIDEQKKRIERLRAKLQQIYDLHHSEAYNDISVRDDVTYEIVCEALELKDDERLPPDVFYEYDEKKSAFLRGRIEKLEEAQLIALGMLSEMGLSSAEKCELAYEFLLKSHAALENKNG